MQTISVQNLDLRRHEFLIIDVREQWEWQIAHLEGAVLIPLATLPDRINDLDPASLIAVMCHHGVRSARAGGFLLSHGFSQVYNVEGGIDAWSKEIDPSLPIY